MYTSIYCIVQVFFTRSTLIMWLAMYACLRVSIASLGCDYLMVMYGAEEVGNTIINPQSACAVMWISPHQIRICMIWGFSLKMLLLKLSIWHHLSCCDLIPCWSAVFRWQSLLKFVKGRWYVKRCLEYGSICILSVINSMWTSSLRFFTRVQRSYMWSLRVEACVEGSRISVRMLKICNYRVVTPQITGKRLDNL